MFVVAVNIFDHSEPVVYYSVLAGRDVDNGNNPTPTANAREHYMLLYKTGGIVNVNRQIM